MRAALLILMLTIIVFADDVKGLSRVKRVIGGSPVYGGQWPWLVNLKGTVVTERIPFFRIPIGFRHYYCGGSVLNDRWILTAAHCFDGDPQLRRSSRWEVKLASGSLDHNVLSHIRDIASRIFDREDWRLWEVDVDGIVIHPGYSRYNYWQDDMALVRLAEPIPSGPRFRRIQRVKLPESGNSTFPAVGSSCVMKGWGCTASGGSISARANSIVMPIYNMETCLTAQGAWDNHKRLCAGYNYANAGICPGDSGGPLTCLNEKSEWIQVGVASYANRQRPGSFPGVFTRVSEYVSWIQDVLNYG